MDDLTVSATLSGSQIGAAPAHGGNCSCGCNCTCACFCFPAGYYQQENWQNPANDNLTNPLGSNFGIDYVS